MPAGRLPLELVRWHGNSVRRSATWTDAATAGLYLCLSTQFAQPPMSHSGWPLTISGLIAALLVVRSKAPEFTLLAVSALTCIELFTGVGAEPLVGIAIAIATLLSRRPAGLPRWAMALIATLSLVLVLSVAVPTTHAAQGAFGGLWLVLSCLCLTAGVIVGSHAAAARSDAQAASEKRETEALREERLRLAREVHDVSSSTLVSIGVQASLAAVQADPEDLRRTLMAVEVRSKHAARQLRTYLTDLRREQPSPDTDSPAIDVMTQVERVLERAQRAGVQCRAELDTVDGNALPPSAQHVLRRALEEALTNVAKHAPGSTASVRLARSERPAVLDLLIDDDGPGFPPKDHAEELAAAPNGGYGLQGMRERASSLAGTLTLSNSPTGGARVHLRIPLSSTPIRS